MTRYKPMLARDAGAPFSDPDWIYEVKWDGIRALAYVGEEFSLRSRNDKELRENFPEIEELKGLVGDAVLDGEIGGFIESYLRHRAKKRESKK